MSQFLAISLLIGIIFIYNIYILLVLSLWSTLTNTARKETSPAIPGETRAADK